MFLVDSDGVRMYRMGVKRSEMNESEGKLNSRKGGARMLTEERQQEILRLVNQHQTITSQDLIEKLDSSESTIRRDLMDLEDKGLLWRIRGGAKARNTQGIADMDSRVASRRGHNAQEKREIAQFASQLIEPGDTVYIDSGTSTEALAELIDQPEAVYVTNAVFHANLLSQKGMHVSIPGGQYKAVTEAVVGEEACDYLDKYNFSIGFFGTNGISDAGLTTPDLQEGLLKKKAVSRCERSYVLADHSKFGLKQRITFARPGETTILTTSQAENVPDNAEVIRVDEARGH